MDAKIKDSNLKCLYFEMFVLVKVQASNQRVFIIMQNRSSVEEKIETPNQQIMHPLPFFPQCN